jgi:hypothetical protein
MALPLILAGAGVGLQLFGMQMGVDASKANLAFQQEQSRHNQIVGEMLALDAIDRGERAVQSQKRKIKAVSGAQRAAIASNGFVVDQDTGADIVQDTYNWGEVDLATMRANSRMEALQIRAGVAQAGISAGIAGVQAGYEQQQTIISGGANILGTLSNYYAS